MACTKLLNDLNKEEILHFDNNLICVLLEMFKLVC